MPTCSALRSVFTGVASQHVSIGVQTHFDSEAHEMTSLTVGEAIWGGSGGDTTCANMCYRRWQFVVASGFCMAVSSPKTLVGL